MMKEKIEDGLKRLAILEKQANTIQLSIKKLYQDFVKLQKECRDLRFKKIKDGWNILCVCGRKYFTKRDPDAALKENRPQCRVCGKRVEKKKQ